MKARKALALVLALLMITALFAGCGSESGKSSAPAQESKSSASASAPAPDASGTSSDNEPEPTEEPETLYGMFDNETYVPLPLCEEGVTLSYFMPTQPFMASFDADYNSLPFFKEMEKRTNVHLDLQTVILFMAQEQFNIIATSGDYPDLLEGVGDMYAGGPAAAVADEVVMALDGDILDNYMPNYKSWLESDTEYMKSAQTVDGDIWCASYLFVDKVENNSGTLIRQDWLDALDMTAPVTYDEAHDVLTAIKNEFGGTMWFASNTYSRYNTLNAGYGCLTLSDSTMADGDPYLCIDGSVVYSPITDNMRQWLTMLHQWWTEGLIYPDYMSDIEDLPDNELIAQGKIGMFVSDCDNMLFYETLGDISLSAMAPLRKNAGDIIHVDKKDQVSQGSCSISGTCENVEIAAKWMDYLYTYDGYILSNYGLEGEGLEFVDGQPQFTDLVVANPEHPAVVGVVLYSKYGGAGLHNMKRELRNYSQRQWDAIELWNTDRDPDYMMPYYNMFTAEESQELNDIQNDIVIYVKECINKFVIGEKSLDEWDDYVARVEAMGIEDALAIYQKAYDRYMAK